MVHSTRMLGLRMHNKFQLLHDHLSLGSVHEDGLNFGLASLIFWQDQWHLVHAGGS
jgi:hypothetical protein